MDRDFFTVVIRVPDDDVARKAIANAIRIGCDFHGGTVTAAGIGDEMASLEKYEAKYGDLEDYT